ncbi:N-acetylmuramoyl-L-alanine amidase [Filimonas lacunae]|nr:N-acetylmuramoyl-L-alanine amidase [Filimonas lacunae]
MKLHARFQWVIVAFAGMLHWGCSHNPYAATNSNYKTQVKALTATVRDTPAPDSAQPPAYWVGTVNFNLRKPNYVIIHHTAQESCEKTLQTFTLAKSQVSAHYVICKDGMVHHMLDDYLRAWHAGVAQWGGNTDINSSSVGIEIDNNGKDSFTVAQINSLLRLLGRLKRDYNIPTAHFIGHADIAPGRKVDPSGLFPWQQLAQNGYGYWYDTTAVQVPESFNALQALRIIGYNVKDSVAAVRAFKLHFAPADSTAVISDENRKMIFDLVRKYE